MILNDLSKAPKHTKIYFDAFGYQVGDFVACEISGNESRDLHHIDNRKMSSTKGKDRIENLIAVTRDIHERYGDKPEFKAYLYQKHKSFMQAHGVKFDEKWIDEQIKKYS